MNPNNSTVPSPARSPEYAYPVFWWSIAASLLAFLCLTHLLVLFTFVCGLQVSPAVAPAACMLSLALAYILNRRAGIPRAQRLWAPALVFTVVLLSLVLASSLFDMSWDGLWYHQTAVYQMAHGWNPIYEPMRTFVPHLQDWVRHYAKGPWYTALSLYITTGSIETAKAAPWLACIAAFAAVYAALLESGVRRLAGALIAALAALNPVTIFELPSYLVDGLMICTLACFAAALVRWIARPAFLTGAVMTMAAILCVNMKQTGLVYLCFACAAGGLYVLLKRRELFIRFTGLQVAILLAGVLVFGYNPYVTNTIHRNHPFYPMLGTKAYPSLADQGDDPIEKWETPHNMMGTSRFLRLAYALFGRPGAQPYHPGTNASFMIPFTAGWSDLTIYYFHDVRISGFGPLFSGIFLLSLIVLGAALIRPGMPRLILLLFIGAIVCSLLISVHTWWARYGPQLWWFPLVAVVAGFSMQNSRAIKGLTWAIVFLLFINVLPIACVHFQWEIDATRTTHEQLAVLKNKKEILVDFQYFGEPFGERLKNGGVSFRPVQTLPCPRPMELISVSPGYPCAVRACIPE